MAIAHSYDMTAKAGSEEALGNALKALSDAVKGIAGSQGAMVMQDRKEPQRFLFVELWEDDASRKAAGSQLPKEVMAVIMGSVAGQLKLADYDRLV